MPRKETVRRLVAVIADDVTGIGCAHALAQEISAVCIRKSELGVVPRDDEYDGVFRCTTQAIVDFLKSDPLLELRRAGLDIGVEFSIGIEPADTLALAG